ncbi:MAG: proline--tRNA ligase [Planctomycetota bacterium]|nr:MAG: proline--tRNA ligase [Planctomycetota bacterium]
MAKKPQTKDSGLPTRAEDYSAWYQEVVRVAELAEHSAVRGCMVIKPYGYALWENIKANLDARFKATDPPHQNAYFPLFIPKSFLQKEMEHAEGFALECAVVTHHRLTTDDDGKLIPDPESKLSEELIVRPTSETIIGESFSKWVNSYRDLPLLINQWANVVRWEMRTRLFLRTAEFLWQEGHTVHADAEDAERESLQMLEIYRSFAEDTMAMPVIVGRKTESEKFAGADHTYCIEAMMQDRKALQAGTSHNLGQNFARAFDITYLSKEQKQELAWTTSWGVSTRLIGGLIMTHGDDAGLVLPPALAPVHVAIIPIRCKKDEDRAAAERFLAPLLEALRSKAFHGRALSVEVDYGKDRPGAKHFAWEKKGVPLRVEVGPRDIEQGQVVYVKRTHGGKQTLSREAFAERILDLLGEIQGELYERARSFRDEHTVCLDDRAAFDAFFTPRNPDAPEIHGGFVRGGWCGDASCEAEVKDALRVTIRCIPIEGELAEPFSGACVACGRPALAGQPRVIWAKAY